MSAPTSAANMNEPSSRAAAVAVEFSSARACELGSKLCACVCLCVCVPCVCVLKCECECECECGVEEKGGRRNAGGGGGSLENIKISWEKSALVASKIRILSTSTSKAATNINYLYTKTHIIPTYTHRERYYIHLKRIKYIDTQIHKQTRIIILHQKQEHWNKHKNTNHLSKPP